MKTFLLLVVMIGLVARGTAEDANSVARFLAGLPVSDSELTNFSQVPAWKEHARVMDQAWTQHQLRQLQKVRGWAPANIPELHGSQLPVFYFFSGPDILYAQALFPNAGTYVLCAKEPVGQIPDPSQVPASELPAALAGLRKSLTSLLNWSFFITQDLRSDIKQRQFSGILPVMEILLVRSGARIVDVTPVSCDKSGVIIEGGGHGTSGARLRFIKGGGTQTLYYFCGDISNGGLGSHDGILRFCERLGRGTSLLKAASYLPHESEFSKIREWILTHSRAVVEDPSGIPLKCFGAEWRIRLWGNHGKPIAIFAKYAEPELEAALASAPRPNLPFGFGYQYLPSEAVLIVAQRQAEPAEQPTADGGLRR